MSFRCDLGSYMGYYIPVPSLLKKVLYGGLCNEVQRVHMPSRAKSQ